MRIWSIHPKYLDPKGLVALWRETLLAQNVLAGKTKGYKNHPQLNRFKNKSSSLKYIGTYLFHVAQEAALRGYRFDVRKILKKLPKTSKQRIKVTRGQVKFEFNHLKRKLKSRNTLFYNKNKNVNKIQLHPLFRQVSGDMESWEVI